MLLGFHKFTMVAQSDNGARSRVSESGARFAKSGAELRSPEHGLRSPESGVSKQAALSIVQLGS